MAKIEITTMVMIQDPTTRKVLVQERVKNWKEYAFPGGHIIDGESLYDCAVREIREESGLIIRNLKSCGLLERCRFCQIRYSTPLLRVKFVKEGCYAKNKFL